MSIDPAAGEQVGASWLGPPAFDDARQAYQAHLLSATIWAFLVVAGAYCMVALLMLPEPALSLAAAGAFILVLLVVRGVLQLGRVQAACWLLVGAFWLLMALVSIYYDGFRNAIFYQHVVVVVVAALLLGGRAGIGVAMLSVVFGGGLLALDAQGMLPPPLRVFTSAWIWAGAAALFVAVALLLHIASKSLQDALFKAQTNEHLARQQNEALRQREAALQASEARWQALVENAPVLISNTTLDGVVTFANQGNTSQVAGLTLFDLADEQHHERVRAAMQVALAEGTAAYEAMGRDGRWYAVRVGQIREGADVVGLMFNALDITDQRRMQKALKQSEQRYQMLNHISPVGIFHADPDGQCRYVNDRLCTLTGRSLEQLLGWRWLEAVYPDDRAAVREAWRRATDTGQGFEAEHRFLRHNGEVAWVYTQAQPEYDVAGQVVGHVGTLTDLTARKRAEEALQASEEKFARAFRSSPDAIMLTLVEDGTIVEVNDGFEKRTGYRREAVVGRTTQDVGLWPEARERARVMQVMQTEGRVRELDLRVRIRSGEVRDCLVSAEHIVIGGRPHLVSITRDVTEQRRAQVEREKLITELEAKNGELERFTYTVSHDLKSPLVTIKGFLGLLRQDLAAGRTDQLDDDLQRIDRAANQMYRLLDELLELSRVGRIANPSESIALTELAQQVVPLLSGQAVQAGVEIEIAPSMPSVWGDRVRLQEVYQNLLENAIKFMGSGLDSGLDSVSGGRVEVGASEDAGGMVRCWVRDTGMGIEAAYQEQVFGLFERLDTDQAGTGVGLALVKRIVEVHGGRVWVESAGLGQGATFYFTLPRADAAAEPPNHAAETQAAGR